MLLLQGKDFKASFYGYSLQQRCRNAIDCNVLIGTCKDSFITTMKGYNGKNEGVYGTSQVLRLDFKAR